MEPSRFASPIPSIGVKGDALLLPANEGARAVFLHDVFAEIEIPTAAPEAAAPTPT